MTETYFRSLLLGVMFLAPVLGGADGGCSPNQIPIGEDPRRAGAGGGPDQPIPCGDITCSAGQVCCNSSCGICTGPDESCTTDTCEDYTCADNTANLRNLIASAQSCKSDSDCTMVSISCLPGDSCTGTVYVNRQLNQSALAEHVRKLNSCVTGDPEQSCPVCLRLDPPPACIANTCRAGTFDEPPQPCAGKSCGESCSNCIDGQPCLAIAEVCDARGECGGPARCPVLDNPCAGKQCGDMCSNCVGPQPCPTIIETCDANGQCSGGFAQCR